MGTPICSAALIPAAKAACAASKDSVKYGTEILSNFIISRSLYKILLLLKVSDILQKMALHLYFISDSILYYLQNSPVTLLTCRSME
jgi:hypothetical protein